MTGMHGQQPMRYRPGPPHLAWSFNHEGEANPAMIAERDQRFGFNTADERQDRNDLVDRAKPQRGVSVMVGRFPNTRPIPGVHDNGDANTHAVPTTGMKGSQAGQ